MEEDLPIRPGVVIPGAELWFVASRASGPGGQHVNKTSSRVTLCWNLEESTALGERRKGLVRTRLGSRLTREGILQVSVESERSQYRNRLLARERLAELLAEALEEAKPRRPTRIPRSVQRRRVTDKRKRGERKKMRQKPQGED